MKIKYLLSFLVLNIFILMSSDIDTIYNIIKKKSIIDSVDAINYLHNAKPHQINLLRNYFYRLTLKKCGKNVVVNFGTIISYKDTTIGDNVMIGTNNIFGRIDILDNVLNGEVTLRVIRNETVTENTTAITINTNNVYKIESSGP